MADKGTIETRLKLTGEDDYQKALKAAYGQLRVLNSELKASTSALGNNATAEEKNAKKAEILKKKIAEQQKIVNQLKAALEQARTEYAGNTEIIQKWEIKLNNAQAALNSMTNDLDAATSGVEKMGNAMQEGANKSVQAVVNIGDVMDDIKGLASSIASTVQGAFQGMIDNIKWGVNQAWALIQGAMADVGNFKAITDAFGGSDVLAESMVRKAQSVGMSGSTVTGLISNLVTRTHAENKDLNALLTAWGEEEGDPLKYLQGSFDNHLEYYDAVWKKFVQKGSSLADAQVLFGKGSSTDARVLGSKWGEASDWYQEYVVDVGIELDQDQIDDIDNLQLKLDRLKTTWVTLKTKLAAGLTAVFDIQGLTDDLMVILKDISLMFFGDKDKKNEYLVKFQVDVQQFITDLFASVGRFGEWMAQIAATFKESPDPTMQAIGGIFQAVADFCAWVTTHSETIVKALQWWVQWKLDQLQFKINTGMTKQEWKDKIKEIIDEIIKIGTAIGLLKTSGTLRGIFGNGANSSSLPGTSGNVTITGATVTMSGTMSATGAVSATGTISATGSPVNVTGSPVYVTGLGTSGWPSSSNGGNGYLPGYTPTTPNLGSGYNGFAVLPSGGSTPAIDSGAYVPNIESGTPATGLPSGSDVIDVPVDIDGSGTNPIETPSGGSGFWGGVGSFLTSPLTKVGAGVLLTAALVATPYQDLYGISPEKVGDLDEATQEAMKIYSAFLNPNDVVDETWLPEDFLAWGYGYTEDDFEMLKEIYGDDFDPTTFGSWIYKNAGTIDEFILQLLQMCSGSEGFTTWLRENGYGDYVDMYQLWNGTYQQRQGTTYDSTYYSPTQWWLDNGGSTDGAMHLDQQSIDGFASAVASRISGMSVQMDGQKVGWLAGPGVSQYLAANA